MLESKKGKIPTSQNQEKISGLSADRKDSRKKITHKKILKMDSHTCLKTL
jgi:hypothetical protein